MQTLKEKEHRPATPRRSEKWKQDREIALEQLRQAGFGVKEGKKAPKNGVYSGIVGKLGKVLEIDIKR